MKTRVLHMILTALACLLYQFSLGQESNFRKAIDLEHQGALNSARGLYKLALKEDDRVEKSKINLKRAELELKAGNSSRALGHWKRIAKKDSTSGHGITALINLSIAYAKLAEKERKANSYKKPLENKFDTLELRSIRSAFLNYRNLIEGDEYYGFPFGFYLQYYDQHTRNYEEVKFQFESMLKLAVQKGQDGDEINWRWSLLMLNFEELKPKLDQYSTFLEKEDFSAATYNSYQQIELRKQTLIREYEDLIKSDFNRPILKGAMMLNYASFLAEENKAVYKKVNFHGSRVDSIDYHLEFQRLLDRLLELDAEILRICTEVQAIAYPGFKAGNQYDVPEISHLTDKSILFLGNQALYDKAAYLLEIKRRYFEAFSWPWARQFEELGILGRKTGAGADFMENPEIFRNELLTIALRNIQALESFSDNQINKLPTDKDKLEWRSVSYDALILGIDIAFENFLITNNNPKGVRVIGSRSTNSSSSSMKIQVDHFIEENDAFNVFYYAEKAKAALLMKEISMKSQGAELSDEFSISEIRSGMDEKTALIEYVITPYNYYQFTITKEYFEIRTRRIDEEDILPHVFGIRNGIIYKDDKTLLESTRYLYKKLIPKLEENITKLVIIPDRELALIPFEVLTSSKVKKKEMGQRSLYPFLIRDYEISYSFSATFWKAKQSGNPASESFTAFAPVFSDQKLNNEAMDDDETTRGFLKDGSYIVPLPGTLAEVESISEIFKSNGLSTSLHINSDASESRIKETGLTNQTILHLASHGFTSLYDSEKSGIMFSPDTSDEDGLLYVTEIIDMDIKSNLVTLSACETNYGKVIRGEGVIGISRSFMVAGASNVIASLWQVSDASTSLLMQKFYENHIGSGLSISASLREAKLSLIQDDTWSYPFFWSPFILVGE